MTRNPPERCQTRISRDDKPRSRPAAHWLITAPLVVLIVGLSVLWLQTVDFPGLKTLRAGHDQPEITLLDYKGNAFAHLGGGHGRDLRLHEMSSWLPAAVIAIEDHRFYSHPGIDLIGMARALVNNIQAGRIVQGGSTISQQLAKLTYVGAERSYSRKLKEAGYALAMESRLSKNQILEAYLNKVYLGGGAYGVDAASRRYFAKSASNLTLPEAAMLAGLIRAPSRFAPSRNLKVAQDRASLVLARMLDEDVISKAEADAAIAEPAVLATGVDEDNLGYFIDWVGAESRLFSSPNQRQLTVQTTLDRELQRHAENSVSELLDRHGADVGARQVAMIAMTPDGRIKAMVGGRNYEESQFNRAVQAQRQPGSAFKLFLYLAALDEEIYPDNGISARPIEVEGWYPRNADEAYPQRISISHAFSHSVNTAAVRLAEHIGRDKIVQKARQLGVTSDLHSHPSLALGSAEVTLLELTAAYATVANGGNMVWPEGINSISGADFVDLYRRQAIDEQVLTEDAVDGMTAMLRDTLRGGTGWRAQLPGFVAGKTGTSSEYRDAWFIGFTEGLVVGIWVGNDDGEPMRKVSGGGLPAMVFRDFMIRSGEAPNPLPAPETDDMIALPVATNQEEAGSNESGFFGSIFSLFES
ncbi:MAG: transglycosylase domain-containing protein [Geminicoccaceae bacterium]